MLKIFLCLKYLKKKKIILLSIAAVALSTALLIVVGSLFTGFINTLESTAVNFVGDVVVTPNAKFPHYDIFIQKLVAEQEIKAATAVLSTQGLLHLGKGKVKGVSVWGVDLKTRTGVSNIATSLLIQSEENKKEISFGSAKNGKIMTGFASIAVIAEPDLANDKYDMEKIKSEFIGKTVVLTSGSMADNRTEIDFTDSKYQPRAKNFRVKKIPFIISDIVFTGVRLLDSRYIYLPIDKLSQKLYPQDDKNKTYANIIHIKLADNYDSKKALEKIKTVWINFAKKELLWPGFAIANTNIETSKQMQARNAAELKKQMNLLLVIFGIVSVAVILLIFCIFYMIVTTKTKDVAIIKSFGASKNTVRSIFVTYGLLIGIAGAAVGFALGAAITININQIEEWIRMAFGLKLWDSSIYLFTKTPNQLDYTTVKWVIPVAILSSVIGSVVPAVSASKLEPVKVLQYE